MTTQAQSNISPEDLIREYNIRIARENLTVFTKVMMPAYEPTWFHLSYAKKLQGFANGDIKKLSISVPPQHGKSTLSTLMLTAFLLGNNPNLKVAVVSYNQSMASRLGRQITRIMSEPSYLEMFPDTRISDGSDGYSKNNEEIEIVGYGGSLRLVGVNGGLTGQSVDILIIDDPYKDAEQAWSPIQRENVQEWFNTVAETRLHNKSQILSVYTRWHPDDLIGVLLKEENHGWETFSYPAIKEGQPTLEDPRQDGEALWPNRHNIERLEAIRARDAYSFESLYQCNPQPKEGLLYGSGFKTYLILPENGVRKSYTDTADMGKDFLCSIAYLENENGIFVIDIIYTRDPMEVTEPLTAKQLSDHKIESALVESNNGGRGFARNVEQLCRDFGNWKTDVNWFTQTQNKLARIHTNSSTVMNTVHFPEGWVSRWPKFAGDLSTYSAIGRNSHDDAADTLTGMVENFSGGSSGIDDSVYDAFM